MALLPFYRREYDLAPCCNPDAVAGSQITMSQPNKLKLRTAIMLAGMITLPAAAVMGIKWPAYLRSEQVWKREKSDSLLTAKQHGSSRQTPSPLGENTTQTAPASPTSPIDRGGKNLAESSDYPVVQAENIVVRPESSLTVLPAVGDEQSSAALNSTTALVAEQPLEVQSIEEFTRIQQRLRGLGATHYVLETYGPTGEAYRFECRMAAGHDAHYSRNFEATDVEPLRAMRTVLAEVESWKSGRLP